jgi:hypothetical protein
LALTAASTSSAPISGPAIFLQAVACREAQISAPAKRVKEGKKDQGNVVILIVF